MESQEREEAAKRIARLSKEQVAKLLIFMAGMEAQRAIQAALEGELDRLPPELSQETAFETVVQRYPRLSDMAALAGYDPKEVESWRQTDQAKSLPLVKNS